jgi:hypothetical protein
LLILAQGDLAFLLAPASLAPRIYLLGDSEVWNLRPAQPLQRFLDVISDKAALAVDEVACRGRKPPVCVLDPKRAGDMVRHDLDSWRAILLRLLEEADMACLEIREHGLDVLAGPQAVDAEVDAGA